MCACQMQIMATNTLIMEPFITSCSRAVVQREKFMIVRLLLLVIDTQYRNVNKEK